MTEKKKSDGGGLRFNKGKINLGYCPTSTQAAIALVFQKNSEKYGGKYPDNNWRRGMDWTIPFECARRHMEEWECGNDLDDGPKGSGLPHLYHALANLAMLVEFMTTYPEGDDRYKGAVRTLSDMEPLEVPDDLGKTE